MTINVDALARDHNVEVNTMDGIEIHAVPSLLSQLRDAVFGGMEGTGGGSAMKAKLPISEAALDLYMVIDREISEAWGQSYFRIPGKENPEVLLSEWAEVMEDDTAVTISGKEWYARVLVTKWESQVEDFFNPPRLAEINTQCPMPECGERWVYSGAENVRQSALRFNRSRETGDTLDARCLACGAIWLPSQFDRLATIIGIDVEQKRQQHVDG